MKEDYLWDKSGDDAQIRQLENALAAFRYRETAAPPALPQKVFTLEKPKRRAFFRFAFPAFAGFAALVAVFSFLWFQISIDRVPVVEIVSETGAIKEAEKTADDFVAAPRETIRTIETIETNKIFPAPKVVKIRRANAPGARRSEKIAARSSQKTAAPVETLTKEERYAYDQLMLALTITGSKLKIVQDKINRIEEQPVVGGR